MSVLMFVKPLLFVDFEDFVEKTHDDGYQGCQHHALYAEGTQGNLGTADAHDDDNRGHNQVAGFGVVHFAVHQDSETADSDNAEEQDADAAHNRHGDGTDDGRQFADEAQENGEAGSTADNPGAIYFGDGHNTDVFAIGGVGGCTRKATDNVAETISKEGTGQARLFNQIPAYDVAGNCQVADVFRQYHESSRSNNHNSIQIKFGCIELGQLEPGSSSDAGEVHNAQTSSEDVAADDTEENGDDAHEAGEDHGANDSHRQGEEGNQNILQYKFPCEARHACGNRSQFQADDGHDGTHSCRGEDDINPFGSQEMDDDAEEDEEQAENDEAALGCAVAAVFINN